MVSDEEICCPVQFSLKQRKHHLQATSPVVFPSSRIGTRAVQAVEVLAQPSAGHAASKRAHTFTFCLEHITQGPYKVVLSLQALL